MSAKKKPARIKIKSKRGAQKRFKVTAKGKVRFRRAFRNHINTKRSEKKERQSRRMGVLQPQDGKLVLRQMPYDV
ncbi:MAG TPA: 50S ribosomal protein L35 [Gammaproteobacteria bacterium]|nr:50S ribosomal protein L35 [Gammaproteobacteria bacterium]